MKKKIKNILLIDDDEINHFIIREFIKELNNRAKCHCVDDVEDALTYLRNCTVGCFPDMIFVDLLMPRLNGFDFLEVYEAEFNKKYPQTKLILLTSSLREMDSIRAESFTCLTDFITKDAIAKTLTIIFEKYYYNA